MLLDIQKMLLLEEIRQHEDYEPRENACSDPLRATESGSFENPDTLFVREIRDSYGLCYEIFIDCFLSWETESWIEARVHFRDGTETVSEIQMSNFESIEKIEQFFDVMWRSLDCPYVKPLFN